MKSLDEYLKLKKEIHDYFGYVEDWVSIPMEDCREYYWQLNQEADGSGFVNFHEEKQFVEECDGNHYQNTIYTQRFLPKWVYRGEDYTMICVDTHVDGNKFLSIFDNKKELKN